ncbi:MAG TPA: hypothetical protein VL443_19945, partial [Cyclobacteriaceae bacterium]|nr:hypothetical protein [Cyclobacteriaceae bacterium]
TSSTFNATDHGFAYSANTLPNVTNSDKISLGAMSGTGNFDAALYNLPANKICYVRAYVITDSFTVYGDEVQFTTLK